MVLVRHCRNLIGIQPHPSAMGAGLDLHAMVFAAREIVAVLGALHVVRLPFGLHSGGVGPLALFAKQLRVLPGEIFFLVPARLVRLHCAETPDAERISNADTGDVKNPVPPVRPNTRSAARSGCGMIPTTFPAALHTPAM